MPEIWRRPYRFSTFERSKSQSVVLTEAARDAYRQLDRDGWKTQDIAALVEYGRR